MTSLRDWLVSVENELERPNNQLPPEEEHKIVKVLEVEIII